MAPTAMHSTNSFSTAKTTLMCGPSWVLPNAIAPDTAGKGCWLRHRHIPEFARVQHMHWQLQASSACGWPLIKPELPEPCPHLDKLALLVTQHATLVIAVGPELPFHLHSTAAVVIMTAPPTVLCQHAAFLLMYISTADCWLGAHHKQLDIRHSGADWLQQYAVGNVIIARSAWLRLYLAGLGHEVCPVECHRHWPLAQELPDGLSISLADQACRNGDLGQLPAQMDAKPGKEEYQTLFCNGTKKWHAVHVADMMQQTRCKMPAADRRANHQLSACWVWGLHQASMLKEKHEILLGTTCLDESSSLGATAVDRSPALSLMTNSASTPAA